MWIGALTDAIKMKAMIGHQLQEAQELECQRATQNLEKEFLVTKTISNSEVWSHLNDWEASIRAEFQQPVNTKQAVRQVSKGELHRLPIELLPGKWCIPEKLAQELTALAQWYVEIIKNQVAMNAMLVVPMAIKFELKYVLLD